MAYTFKIISIVTLILGILFIIAAAIIFVKLRIWEVMADLSGKTAHESIERLRSQSGQPMPRKRHYSYVVNSSSLRWRNKAGNNDQATTAPVVKQTGKNTEHIKKDNRTDHLRAPRTDVIKQNSSTATLENSTVTTEAVSQSGTVILSESADARNKGTEMLRSAETTVISQTASPAAYFNIITDIVMIHTSEKISLN